MQAHRTPKQLRQSYRTAFTGDALDYAVILRADPCSYCGQPAEAVDHIIPKPKGGPRDDWTNLTAACRRCNSSKQHSTLLGHLRWVVRLRNGVPLYATPRSVWSSPTLRNE